MTDANLGILIGGTVALAALIVRHLYLKRQIDTTERPAEFAAQLKGATANLPLIHGKEMA